MRIGVIGAGHAGVEAAWRASQLGAEVVLFSGESVLPYFRPRVVPLAFGHAELDNISLRPESWYREHEIDLRLNAEVIELDARERVVTAGGREELFDALVLATGAAPALLSFVREFPHDVVPLWGVEEGLAIRERLDKTRQLLILGGGISGVESALYARQAGLDVTLVEKIDHLVPQQLGAGAATVLAHRLRKAGIHVVTGRYAVTVVKREHLHVTLDDVSELSGDLIVTTVGAMQELKLFEQAGLKVDRGIIVDEHQQTSVPGVFACGDIAQRDGLRTTTVVHAHEQGRGAGENAVAFVRRRPLVYVPEPLSPLLFKHNDMEIESVGPPAGDNLVEVVLTTDGQTVYRSVLLEPSDSATSAGGILCGVQMIGSHEGFRQLLDSLGRPWSDIVRSSYPTANG
ncbi:MAG: NAD(P)/FAD-dependent oxidoreductase [Planctomycetes bacterium]|nr:NAD(P)/FAD-dependent oxidoreductase [Planctomycetota bacterium]